MNKLSQLNKKLKISAAEVMRLRATTFKGKSDGGYPSKLIWVFYKLLSGRNQLPAARWYG